MSNSVQLFFLTIIAVVVITLIPAYQTAVKQDDLAQQVAYTETTKFVDSVRTKGYLTPQMLEEYKSKIEIGSYVYRVEIVHEKKMYNPVFTDPKDSSTFTGEYLVQYDEFHTKQIEDYLYNSGKDIKTVKYKMSEGDFFTVNIKNINTTMSTILLDAFQGITSGNTSVINVPYGGMIINENY